MVLLIIGIAIIGVFSVSLFREIKPSFAVVISLATCILLIFTMFEGLSEVILKLSTYIAKIGVSSELFYYLLKVVGIGYIIEFVVDIAEECGSLAIANKVAIAGKVIIAGISLPILFDLLDMLLELV